MFQIRNLSVGFYAQGFTFWHYHTTDTLGEVFKQNYMKAAADMMKRGDMVAITAKDSGIIYRVSYVSPHPDEMVVLAHLGED